MEIAIAPHDGVELVELKSILDEHFVQARGRSIPVDRRFPDLFDSSNPHSFRVIRVKNELAAIAAIKHFTWEMPERTWSGVMLGFILTQPKFRRRGIASRLVAGIIDEARLAGMDVAVLWTTQPRFYQQLGWITMDSSLLAEATGGPIGEGQTASGTELTDDVIDWIERMRARWLDVRIRRSANVYSKLPFPAQQLDAYVVRELDAEGYALVGRDEECGYLYEWLGDPQSYLPLWRRMMQTHQKLLINDWEGSMTSEWVSMNRLASFERQTLMMVTFLSARANPSIFPCYVPYLDRI